MGTEALFTYNANDQLVKMDLNRVDAIAGTNTHEVTLYEYDGRNLITKEINALGDGTIYTYDGNGNMVSKADPDGYVTEYSYTALDLVRSIDYNGAKQATYQYNAVGELVKMVDWTGTNTFEVDLLGQLKKATDHKGNVTEYTYDEVGNQTSITYPDGGKVQNSYDAVYNLTGVKDPDNGNYTYVYDASNRATKLTYPNGWVEEYTYDAESNLLKVVDIDPFQIYNKQPKLKYEYRYYAEGNVIYEYKRDSDGVENNVTFSDYSYDALNRLTGSTRSQNWYPYETEKKTYAYDTLGNLIRETGPGKQDVTTYRYNDLNQLVAKEECGYIQSITRIHDYAYTYDKRGNLVKEEEVCAPTTQGPKNITIGAYVYDETNRMVQGANEKGEVSAYTYNGLDVRVGTELILEDNTHGYTDFHCETPSVDTGLVTPEVVKSDYVVDYTRLNIDHRVLMEREVGGYDFRYVYGLDKLQVKVTGEGTDWWGQSVKQCVNLAYVHTDRLGSVTNLTDEFGRVTARSDYGDWGEVRTYESITVDGGFRMLMPEVTFAGHEYDDVVDQFYAKYRFYDADLKRFDSIDPVKGFVTDPMSLVQYLYVKDNPKTRLDPLGLIDPDIALGNLKDRGPEVVLSKGNENNSKAEVKRVQTMLSNLGLYDDKIDGSYGPNTKQAVLTFQKRYGTLDNSGIVDTDTLAFLQRASSSPEANKASLQQENVRVKEERMFASSAATSAKVEQAPKNPYSALMDPMGMDKIKVHRTTTNYVHGNPANPSIN